MIKNDNNFVNVSLDSILGEILNISNNIVSCKSSIDHMEDSMHLLSLDIKKSLKEIDNRLLIIEKEQYSKNKINNFIWKLMKTSPFDIFKWIFSLGVVLYFLSLSFEVNVSDGIHKIYQLIGK